VVKLLPELSIIALDKEILFIMLRFYPQQYRVLDFYEWDKRDGLYLQPKFQRRPSWTEQARSYLIDTILKELPVPKLFLREITNLKNKTTIREVVDGQQRLRAVLDFIEGKLVVSRNFQRIFKNNFYPTGSRLIY
jgi:hypothetical protein